MIDMNPVFVSFESQSVVSIREFASVGAKDSLLGKDGSVHLGLGIQLHAHAVSYSERCME